MNQREKMLVAAVAALVGLWLLVSLYRGYAEGLTKRKSDLATAKKELSDLNLETVKARLAMKKLDAWREQSLPNTDPNDPQSKELAYQLYSAWLQETLKSAGINFARVDKVLRTATISPEIGTIGISVIGPAELPNVVNFLHKFYSSAQMHQVAKLALRKEPDGMKMEMQVEALLLPGATHTDTLPDGKANPFTLVSVNEYRTRIVDRNIFNPFSPPSDPSRPPPIAEGTVDNSRFAKFTGTTHGTEGLLAWIYVMSTGDNWLVKEGETVKVDDWTSKVVTIEPRAIIIEITENGEAQQSRVEAGGLLREGRRPGGFGRGRGRGRGRGSRDNAVETTSVGDAGSP